MSRVDHWRNHKLCDGNRMKSGTLGNVRHKVHKLEYNNKRKIAGKPMLRRVHMQHRKKILKDSEVKNHEN